MRHWPAAPGVLHVFSHRPGPSPGTPRPRGTAPGGRVPSQSQHRGCARAAGPGVLAAPPASDQTVPAS